MGSKVHSKNDSSLSCKFLQVMFNKRRKSLLRDSGPFPDDHHIVNQKCICSASIQSLLSPIADSLSTHYLSGQDGALAIILVWSCNQGE